MTLTNGMKIFQNQITRVYDLKDFWTWSIVYVWMKHLTVNYGFLRNENRKKIIAKYQTQTEISVC